MKELSHKLWAKAVALTLAVLVMMALIVSAVGIVYLGQNEYYTNSQAVIYTREIRRILDLQNWDVEYAYYEGRLAYYAPVTERYFYEIFNEKGECLAGTYDGQEVLFTEDTVIERSEKGYTMIKGYLCDNSAEPDLFTQREQWIAFCYGMRYWVFGILGGGILLLIFLLIFLYGGAGYREGAEGPRLNFIDRIPFDLYTLFLVFLFFFEIQYLQELSFSTELLLCLIVFLAAFDLLLLLSYTMSFATRLKVGRFWKGTLIGMIFAFFLKGMKKGIALLMQLPLIWRTAGALAAITLIEFLALLIAPARGTLMLWWLLSKFILIPLILYIALCLRKLQKGGQRIAEGDLSYQVEIDGMHGDFKAFGGTLNSIRFGINHAVEERMKSERFKTELITNVSHDIKTPLTSIINYVDLIQKEELPNEKLKEYVAVLERQAARLKKLIEDLMEASKASTGNLPVRKEPCDAGVLLMQLAGEYDERLSKAQLELVLRLPEEKVIVLADSRHFWRILDNLMSNICKYAQKNTRVYIDLIKQEKKVEIIFRNISKAPLPRTGEELVERFVRGDSSRNTEGSGLGLSIARSLCELQGAILKIETDGDLLKAIVVFPQ